MQDNYNKCVEGCSLPSTPNDLKILFIKLKREVEELIKTTEGKLLIHDGKIAEMCKYIKDNLSNSIRCLFDSMMLSGELDKIINETVLTGFNELSGKLEGLFSVKNFGAVGDGIHDDTVALQSAIDFCYKHNCTLLIPYGIYRTNTLIFKCNMKGFNNPIILFNDNNRFQNFECDGSVRYQVTSLEGIIFESDKSSYYNMNCDVKDRNVIRKYGQRIWIGNNSKNVYSNNYDEMLSGIGWWNQDYSQWIESKHIDKDDVKSTYANITNKTETNMIKAPYGIVIDKCKFIGFGVGLTVIGTYGSKITNTEFARCKIGVVTTHAGMLPGKLNDSKSKVTTFYVENCLFDDISYFGIYGDSLLQAKIYNNIFQPVGISLVLIAGADNYFYNNYSEIVNSGVLLATNDVKNCVIENNFTNKEYSKYNTYVRYGLYNTIGKHTGNLKCYVAAACQNSDFDELLELEKDNYFYVNGNSQARNKTKYVIFTTTGIGTGINVGIKKSTRPDQSIPNLRISQTGLEFTGIEEILSVECLQDYNSKCLITFYNIENGGNPNVFYVEEWDDNTKTFVRKDLRTNGVKCSFRVAFNDGYKR